MAAAAVQNYKNHTRFHPPYHFFLVPVTLLAVIATAWRLVAHPSIRSGSAFVLAIAAVVAVYLLRTYPLKVQDRVIRLEERLRLMQVLPDRLRPRIAELTPDQLVGLRFASDTELPGLVEKTLAGNLKSSDIKKAIVDWRPDYLRV